MQEVEEGVQVASEGQRSDLEEEAAENDEDQEREAHQSVEALNRYFKIFINKNIFLTFDK